MFAWSKVYLLYQCSKAYQNAVKSRLLAVYPMDDCLKGREHEWLDLCMILKILENLAFNCVNPNVIISIVNYVHQIETEQSPLQIICTNVFVSSTVDRTRIRPRLHETGPMSNRYENRNCQHVHMRPVRKSHIFWFISLPAIVVFLQRFAEHAICRSKERNWDRSEIYLCSHSSRSGFVPVWR